MKRKLFFVGIVVLMISGGFFWACQKDEVETGYEEGLSLKVQPVILTPTLTIFYNPVPCVVGEDVNITAMVSYMGNPLNCGQVQLFYATDGLGNPVPTTTSNIVWINATGQPMDAPGGSVSKSYATPGLYGWKAQYQSSGSNCDYANLTGNNAFTIDIQVVEPDCTEPLTITPYLVEGTLTNGVYTFTTKWVVNACEDFTNLKTQGGLTAGSELVSTNPTASNVKTTKQNTIINWIEPVVNAGFNKEYTVVFTKTLKNYCTTYDITGAWSAKGLNAQKAETVAGYDNKIYYTTPCP